MGGDIGGKMKVRENERQRQWEENRVRGKYRGKELKGERERENEKETERGLYFVYLLYTKRLLNLAPLTPPWREITCHDNIIYKKNNT